MLNLGDVVRVKDVSIPILCQITNLRSDKDDITWYECTPIEFKSIKKEFTEDRLEKIY